MPTTSPPGCATDGSPPRTGCEAAEELGAELDATRPGFIIGTPLYISPEQPEGLKATAESGIYSLGVGAEIGVTHLAAVR